MHRVLWSLLLLCALLGAARPAQAQAAAQPPRLHLVATPLLGSDAPIGSAWFTVAVRVSNPGDVPIEGSLELYSQISWGSDPLESITRAPFSVAGRSVVTVLLPIRGFMTVPRTLEVRARDADAALLATTSVAAAGHGTIQPATPLLFDLSVPSRIAPSLRGANLPVSSRRMVRSAYGSPGLPQLAVSSPQVNTATGEPVLPQRAAGYASATVVLARSDTLARLGEAELTALANWTLAGGGLAVVIARPEDLRGPLLQALIGGQPEQIAAPAALRGLAEFDVAIEPSAPGPSPFGPAPMKIPHGHAPAPPPPPGLHASVKQVAPSPPVSESLVGFAGGNLRPSRWGASCSYGLGEVHLLAFDATTEPQVSDEWVQLELQSLVVHAWDRKDHIAMPHAERIHDSSALSEVRRHLDPNQRARWSVAVAALLLLLYAVLAGPVNFYLAAKRGRPLRALIHLPIWAAVALALVVLLGVLAKGVKGRTHRLTLVEAGAGMERAATVRFRGFFAASADRLQVRATERGGVLDVASDRYETQHALVVDRDGARLEGLRTKPWQTVLVREDGFMSLAGGLSIVRGPSGEIELHNRLARDLVAVVVKSPDEHGLRYFPRLRDGQRVKVSDGRQLSVSGVTTGHASLLATAPFRDPARRDAPGIDEAWQAFSNLAGSDTEWWPLDTPVVLAQMVGGEGRSTDSGLRVKTDRVLVRVVGYGGTL